MNRLLILPQLKIHNANALSSPFTIGFPAMTAWLGAVHALQRKLNKNGHRDLKFIKTGVVCHEIDLQTYKGKGDYVHSIVGTSNPLEKNGKRPSFIEEARCHLTVTLVIEYEDLYEDYDEFKPQVKAMLHTMKFASGDLLSCTDPEMEKIDDPDEIKKIMRYLMPGHCLIQRSELMQQSMQQGQNAIEALLDYLKVSDLSYVDEKEQVHWQKSRKEKGWLVPIAVGYQGISQLGNAKNQRDPNTPHRFADSVVTLGEFVMPYRLNDINEMLWHYEYQQDKSLYLCKQTHNQ